VGSADGPHWRGRGHFYAAAAQAMRREVVDLARYKKRKKPGGARARVFLDVDRLADPQPADDLLDLHDALTAFAAVEPQIADLVTLRYFGGLT
jgi:DNA-directed RNA polymerase specialized sigma24 family protein